MGIVHLTAKCQYIRGRVAPVQPVLLRVPAIAGQRTVKSEQQRRLTEFAIRMPLPSTQAHLPVRGDWKKKDTVIRSIRDLRDGRMPFPGNFYAKQGIAFRNPNGYPLFIAPEGLFWNTSNSLSVGRFPFDPLPVIFREDDDLIVRLDPPCLAVGSTVVDNGPQSGTEFIQFLDELGNVVAQALFPPNFTSYRAFIGIVSEDQAIGSINIVEDPNRSDDVDYDDFVLFPESGAECFMVVGNGPGSSSFVGASYLFQTQVGPSLEAVFPGQPEQYTTGLAVQVLPAGQIAMVP
jgi:hypothetical protein